MISNRAEAFANTWIRCASKWKNALRTSRCFSTPTAASDAWSAAEAEDFYAQAIDLEKEIGVPVSHETHRRRYFATPWQTRHILQQFPDLRITCDLSHWVCVCERLLPDLGETIALAAQHCHHVHARVGFAEGPQVPDPSAPEYATHLAAHEAWWEQIWRSQEATRIHPLDADSRVWPAAVLAHAAPYQRSRGRPGRRVRLDGESPARTLFASAVVTNADRRKRPANKKRRLAHLLD